MSSINNKHRRRQYTPLTGEAFEDSSQASSLEEEPGFYQRGGLPFSLNANPTDIRRTAMSNNGYTEGLPPPITFADKEKEPSVERSQEHSTFTDSFEQSLKSVSDYGGVHEGQFSFVSTVSRRLVCVRVGLCVLTSLMLLLCKVMMDLFYVCKLSI